jgi:glycosyltransferase involved in cell wall biosynthesis
VRFPAWVSGEELEALYAEATCFVLPSLIEGFGLPVLEAMARGVPVACSDRPALPEVAGDAALLFDPTDQTAVTDAVRRLLTDVQLRRHLASRGLDRARLFSWRRTAELTLASYRRAVGD